MLLCPADDFSDGASAAGCDEPAGTLTIYTQFAHPPSALSIGHMHTELDAIMLPFNLRFDWRSLEHSNGSEDRGRNSGGELPGRVPAGYGAAHGAAGPRWVGPISRTAEILPFADVDCDTIRELMTSSFSPLEPPMERERPPRPRHGPRARSRAVSSSWPTPPSTHPTGIAKASYTGTELAAGVLRFDEAQLRSVRAALPAVAGF
jgi:hypothetical protein